MNRYRKHILTLAVMLMMSLINPMKMNAQPADPGCDPLDPACPIDGGVSLLIAAGIGIGAKRAYDLKKKDSKKI